MVKNDGDIYIGLDNTSFDKLLVVLEVNRYVAKCDVIMLKTKLLHLFFLGGGGVGVDSYLPFPSGNYHPQNIRYRIPPNSLSSPQPLTTMNYKV